MQAENNILLVRVPETDVVRLRELRDYILDSLGRGVLPLPDEAPCEVLALPPLGGVAVGRAVPDAAPEPAAGKPPAIRAHDVGPLGRNTTEKREIMERLKAYREKHGLGCWAYVAKAGGKLTEDQLRDMCAGTALLPVAQWRLAARALDKVEAKGAVDANSD